MRTPMKSMLLRLPKEDMRWFTKRAKIQSKLSRRFVSRDAYIRYILELHIKENSKKV